MSILIRNILAVLPDAEKKYVVKKADVRIEDDKISEIVLCEGSSSGVEVTNSGVDACGEAQNCSAEADEIIDGKDRLLIPGMVNAHTHSYMSFMRNVADDLAFTDWLFGTISPIEDAMTDEEIFAVIGHEIGHLKHADTKNMMKQAYKTAAVKDAIGAINPTLEQLTNSQLAAIAVAYKDAQFSQAQEFAADQESFNVCIANNYSPYAMYNALNKLVELAGGNSGSASKVAQMFSTHPDSATRAARIKEMADNYNAQ